MNFISPITTSDERFDIFMSSVDGHVLTNLTRVITTSLERSYQNVPLRYDAV